MRYFIIAGEASGDLHGASLIAELKRVDANANFNFWGGDLMSAQAEGLVQHFRETSFMGFVEVAKNIGKIKNLFEQCKNQILNFNPDIIIYIDYPGFNLRMAKWSYEKGFKNYQYIIPQLWAWKEKRYKLLKRLMSGITVILPFEKLFLQDRSVESQYFGHPLMDYYKDLRPSNNKNHIALFPGSRKQEIKRHLPIMLGMIEHFSNLEFKIAARTEIGNEFYKNIIGDKKVNLEWNASKEILLQAKAAIISSGTASLEACIFKIPQIVIYKGNAVSFQIAKQLVKVEYISLVNLIAGKLAVKELIQDDCNHQSLKVELEQILNNQNNINSILKAYDEVIAKLGSGEVAKSVASHVHAISIK